MTDLTSINLDELLPQRPPFRFVDSLQTCTEEEAVTAFAVKPDGLFVETGELLAAGLVENMAQSSAARVGYVNKYIRHLSVKIGFIGSVKGLRVLRCPRVGEVVRTTISLRQEIFGISLVVATVRSGEEVLAEATLKTVEVD